MIRAMPRVSAFSLVLSHDQKTMVDRITRRVISQDRHWTLAAGIGKGNSEKCASNRSAPGVEFIVGASDPVPGHVGVYLGGGDVGVSEHGLDRPEVRSSLQKVGCE